MRLVLPALLLAAPLAASRLSAQTTPQPASGSGHTGHDMAGMKGMDHGDPDKMVNGGLKVPGWTARFDRAEAKPTAVSFTRMGTGYHVTAGPAAIYYDAKQTVSGNYTVSGTFTQMKAPMHPEAYGLFAGGKDLAGAAPSYVYFIVRGDGKFMVKHRANAHDVHTIADWTANPAIKSAGSDGKATNALQIRVAADSVRFVANGTPVFAVARKETGPLAGIAGFRVNHNLDVHVDAFSVARNGTNTASK